MRGRRFDRLRSRLPAGGLDGRSPGAGCSANLAGSRADSTSRRAAAGSGPEFLDRGGGAARIRADPDRHGRRRGAGGAAGLAVVWRRCSRGHSRARQQRRGGAFTDPVHAGRAGRGRDPGLSRHLAGPDRAGGGRERPRRRTGPRSGPGTGDRARGWTSRHRPQGRRRTAWTSVERGRGRPPARHRPRRGPRHRDRGRVTGVGVRGADLAPPALAVLVQAVGQLAPAQDRADDVVAVLHPAARPPPRRAGCGRADRRRRGGRGSRRPRMGLPTRAVSSRGWSSATRSHLRRTSTRPC